MLLKALSACWPCARNKLTKKKIQIFLILYVRKFRMEQLQSKYMVKYVFSHFLIQYIRKPFLINAKLSMRLFMIFAIISIWKRASNSKITKINFLSVRKLSTQISWDEVKTQARKSHAGAPLKKIVKPLVQQKSLIIQTALNHLFSLLYIEIYIYVWSANLLNINSLAV